MTTYSNHVASALRSLAAAHLDGDAATAAYELVRVLALRAGCWIELRELDETEGLDAVLLAMADRIAPDPAVAEAAERSARATALRKTIDGARAAAEAHNAPAPALTHTAERILSYGLTSEEAEVVRDIALRAETILTREAYALNGQRPLSAEARRRLRNAIVAEWSLR